MFLLIPYAESRALNLITVIFLWPSCTDLQTNKLLQSLTCLAMPLALELIYYVTRIRQRGAVSRIGYISDTDTCRIRDGYVS